MLRATEGSQRVVKLFPVEVMCWAYANYTTPPSGALDYQVYFFLPALSLWAGLGSPPAYIMQSLWAACIARPLKLMAVPHEWLFIPLLNGVL